MTVGQQLRAGVDVTDVRFGSARSPRRLDGVRLSARPGELVAVIGPSGAGKSTLLDVLGGLLPATGGRGTVGDVPLDAPATSRAGRVGYVPQAQALHRELTPRQELRYAARLRDTVSAHAALEARVGHVLAALDMTDFADRPIRSLSGGEQKRVSVAVEMVADPDVLLLDEPTTGLDPHLERQLITALRAIADSGRAIVFVTHSTAHLDQCDRLLVLTHGGRPLYFGPPEQALVGAGAASYVDLFELTRELPSPPLPEPAPGDEVTVALAPPRQRQLVADLQQRDVVRLLADRRGLWLLLAQAPLLGLMVRAITTGTGLGLGALSVNPDARRVLLTLVLCAVWLGSTNAVREIVKDRAAIRRERVAGVAPTTVLVAKLGLLCAINIGQAVILVLVGVAGSSTVARGALLGNVTVELMVDLAACGIAASCVALAISALARGTDQALVLLPLVLVPQLVLSGGVMSLADTPALRPLSYLSTARWGLSAVAATTDLRGLETRTAVPVPLDPADLRVARHEDADSGWDHDAGAWALDLLGLGGLAALSLAAAAAGLRRSG